MQYVSNIYKYYVAYKLVQERTEQRDAAKAKATGGRATRPRRNKAVQMAFS